jgi:hypothetical protein
MPRVTSERFGKQHEPTPTKQSREERQAPAGSGARNPLFKFVSPPLSLSSIELTMLEYDVALRNLVNIF